MTLHSAYSPTDEHDQVTARMAAVAKQTKASGCGSEDRGSKPSAHLQSFKEEIGDIETR